MCGILRKCGAKAIKFCVDVNELCGTVRRCKGIVLNFVELFRNCVELCGKMEKCCGIVWRCGAVTSGIWGRCGGIACDFVREWNIFFFLLFKV